MAGDAMPAVSVVLFSCSSLPRRVPAQTPEKSTEYGDACQGAVSPATPAMQRFTDTFYLCDLRSSAHLCVKSSSPQKTAALRETTQPVYQGWKMSAASA
jgi:hypothetical protein